MEVKVGTIQETRFRFVSADPERIIADPQRAWEQIQGEAISGIKTLFPGAGQHAGHSEIFAGLVLPIRVTDDDLSKMNSDATNMHQELQDYCRRYMMTALAERKGARLESAVLQFIPLYPTLLPEGYGSEPLKSLRAAIAALKIVLGTGADNKEKANAVESLKLVWYPGASHVDETGTPDSLAVRRFVRAPTASVEQGHGICFCDAWSTVGVITPEAGHNAASINMTLQLMSAAVTSGKASVDAILAMFQSAAGSSVDTLKTWSQLMIALHRGTGATVTLRARCYDYNSRPVVSAAPLPSLSHFRPSQLEPAIFRTGRWAGGGQASPNVSPGPSRPVGINMGAALSDAVAAEGDVDADVESF